MKHKILVNGITVELEQLPNGKFKKPDLAEKYKGLKYSIAVLKQTNETIMIFQKPYKTKSCLHDTLAYENGDDTISCGALDIDKNRVPASVEDTNIKAFGSMPKSKVGDGGFNRPWMNDKQSILDKQNLAIEKMKELGRYPSQIIIQCICEKVETTPTEVKEPEEVSGGIWKKSTGKPAGRTYKGGAEVHTNPDCPCAILDKQSGVKKGNNNIRKNKVKTGTNGIYSEYEAQDSYRYNDTAGSSKILHKCDFEKDEHDLYLYNPKVSKAERNAGCEEMDIKKPNYVVDYRPQAELSGDKGRETPYAGTNRGGTARNNHPTLKPIALNEKVLRLFKTPNEQKIIYPFAGSFSEVIGGVRAGFADFEGSEINPEYIKIGEARLKYWTAKKTLF
jgi:DNA modification methylase